jgi:hypothetical protein
MIRLFPPEERSDKPGNHAARKRDHHHPQGGKKLFPGGRFVKLDFPGRNVATKDNSKNHSHKC